jgi:hypothetical protein
MANITEQKLRRLIKAEVSEALATELMKIRALVLPEVSNWEQCDIERRYKKPSRKAEKILNLRV